MENLKKNKPNIFNNLLGAWTIARPIKAIFTELQDFFIGIKDLKKKVDEAKNTILYEGGIYSIYSEKTKYGMGKSQFACFLQQEYEKISSLNITSYHSLSVSLDGFQKLKKELNEGLLKCNQAGCYYFFIDEVDLISDSFLSEEEIAKRIEKFANILIEISEEAFNKNKRFYIFLVLSKRIQDDFEKLLAHRITRRITPLTSVDIQFTNDDIEQFATHFFSILWVSNYKNIKNKFNKKDYKFHEIIGIMISDFMNNLDYLNLDINSSVIGDYVEKFRNIYDIILDGVSEDHLNRVNFDDKSTLGTKVEGVFKEYLLSRNKPFIYEENGHQIKIIYVKDNIKIGRHETDGYYNFLIGDTPIGIMPVEITAQKDIKGRKKNQLKTFTEKYNTLLIWMFIDRNKVIKELKKFREDILIDIPNELYELIIPKDFVKYILILKDRKFSLLEELKEGIINDIQTYLTKYAKNLFNRWMMEKPIKTTHKNEKEEVKPVLREAEEKVERLFDNLFSYFGDKNKKTHGTLTKKLSEEVKYLNKGLNLEEDFLNSEIIYREIIEKLKKHKLGRFNKPISDRSFLIKETNFTKKEAITICTPIIISRIKTTILD